jgi:hypothetical protein
LIYEKKQAIEKSNNEQLPGAIRLKDDFKRTGKMVEN